MEFSWSTLIIVILVILVIYFIWSIMASSSSSTVISSEQDANAQTTISIPDKSYSFAVSAWIYVTDWDSTTGEIAIISSESDASSNPPNLLVSLGKDTNTLNVTLGNSGSTIPPIPNIPLQTWVSIILNVNNGSSIVVTKFDLEGLHLQRYSFRFERLLQVGFRSDRTKLAVLHSCHRLQN